jgi:hypothetical protein
MAAAAAENGPVQYRRDDAEISELISVLEAYHSPVRGGMGCYVVVEMCVPPTVFYDPL